MSPVIDWRPQAERPVLTVGSWKCVECDLNEPKKNISVLIKSNGNKMTQFGLVKILAKL